MDYQLITNICLIIASFIALAIMLRRDMVMLQQQDYSNKKFMQWLHSSDETYSSKRIVSMATLVGCATSYARESWMVVALITLAVIALDVAMVFSKKSRAMKLSARGIATILVVLAIVAACASSLFIAKFKLEAGMLLLLFTSFSYVLLLGVNWIAGLFSKKTNNKTQSINQDEEI